MLPDNAAPLLALAFAQLLGRPERGSMAFVRCLPPDAARELAADERFKLADWQVGAVVDTKDATRRWITADEAVEWREDKARPALLRRGLLRCRPMWL